MANSTRSAGEIVAGYCALTHKRVLHVIDDLDDAALRERPGRANPIAFDLWHIARWADWLQTEISTTRGRTCARSGSAKIFRHDGVGTGRSLVLSRREWEWMRVSQPSYRCQKRARSSDTPVNVSVHLTQSSPVWARKIFAAS